MCLQSVSPVVLAALLLFCSPINGEVCVGSLPNEAHGVQGQLCIVDSRTLVIRNFYYDSRGPDAHLYYYTVGQSANPSGGGFFIPHPDTGGAFVLDSSNPVVNETLQFTLPGEVLACDIGTFTIWCRAARAFFTRLVIPADTFTTSASEAASDPNKILCREEEGGGGTQQPDVRPTTDDFDNCEQLHESLSLAWTVNRTSESVQFMLCGCVGNDQAEDNTWLGFGLSGSTSATQMFRADATIVWVDNETVPHAEDYYLSAYLQCRDGVGACPDTEDSSGECSNNVALLQGWKENGQQCVVYSRNFTAGDECDRVLDPDNEQQYIVWGIGGLGETAFRHFTRAQAGDPPIHLGRSSSSDCSALQCMSCDVFQNQRIVAPSSTTFVARIGPSGDERGYMGITGFAGWGIAWFINGTLIPELVVQRGSTYTFIVYGGDDPSDAGNYHPFYITDSRTGGRLLNTQEEREEETVYAGFDGDDNPTGVGPLCSIESTTAADNLLSDCDATLTQYEAALQSPDPACGANTTENVVVWTPDENTPDLVYYQCASHLNLGWKVMVEDGPAPEVVREVCVGSLPNLAHGVSGQLCIVGNKSLVIRNFYYDSGGPGGAFVRDSSNPVVNETLQFTLPGEVFACDIGTFTIWCRAARAFFTRLVIPADTFTTSASEAASDPSKILCTRGGGTQPDVRPTTDDFDNCEQLYESLSLAWTVNRTSESVQFMLCGCVGNDQAEDNTWLGFGLSGSTSATQMFGADATIVWVDDEKGPQAEDYYLSDYLQCRDGVGACPDTEDSSGECSNNVALLQGWKENGQQCVVYSRNFTASDGCDQVLDPDNEQQYIVWGIGGLGETAFRHFTRAQAGDPPIHLGRSSSSDCSALQCMSCDAFHNQQIVAPSSATFVARIGPSGDERGYMGITGFAGWGIAWFINGTLIPELVVQRGSTYTFIVYGGDDPSDGGNYHPFYITDSRTGGRLLNTQEEKDEETVYAGFDGDDNPTGVGPLCSIESTTAADNLLSDCDATLTQYEAALQPPDPACGADATGNVVVWTPDKETPDVVYYQCASHLSLGWRIMVEDPEDAPPTRNATRNATEPTLDTVTEGSIPTSHASLWLLLCLVSSSLLHVLL